MRGIDFLHAAQEAKQKLTLPVVRTCIQTVWWLRTGVVAILHEMEPHLSTENELELSFDDMSPGTIWRLLDHMRELQRVNENGALRPVDSDPDTEDSDA